jgi:hypothetical protein
MVVINMDASPAKNIKFTVNSSDLAPGDYKVNVLVDVKNSNATFPDLKVDAGGAISNYAPLPTLDPGSAFVLELKKTS